MLRGYYAPSGFDSIDRAPEIGAAQKLDIIANSPVTAIPTRIGDKIYNEEYFVTLPFAAGSSLGFGISTIPHVLQTELVDVGDKELYGHGIGSRLLRAACRYAIDRDPRVNEFSTGWARLGLVNTAVKVFGIENVAILHNKRYGWNGEAPLDAIFDDKPVIEGKPYIVGGIEARIDHNLAAGWEQPVYTLPSST